MLKTGTCADGRRRDDFHGFLHRNCEGAEQLREKKNYLIEAVTVFVAFLIYFGLSCALPMEQAPDESMRYMIPEFIYRYHRLPVGTEQAVRDGAWGFSYAFTPYLPSIVGAGLMRMAAFFTENTKVLLTACRFVSVAAATGTVWLGFRIGRRLFEEEKRRFLFVVCIAFLPQFAFLASYLNNDAFAVFTAMLIFHAWLYGRETHWNYKSCLLLSAAIGLCALTYYNAYGWILCSIIFFFGSVWQDKDIEDKWKHAIKRGCVIAIMALSIAGWFFVRNAVLYNGDFLGMQTMYAEGELHAAEGYKPSQRLLYAKAGLPVWSMLLDTEWIKDTAESFFAVFGYTSIYTYHIIYMLYYIFVIAGILFFIYGMIRRREKQPDFLLYVCCVLCLLIPLVLSIRYSYAIDYQAQGRYLMSGLPAMAFFISRGYGLAFNSPQGKRGWLPVAASAVWLALFAIVFGTTMIPELYTGF